MTSLVLADHDNQELKDSTHKTVSAAAALGGDVVVLVAGSNCAGIGEAAAKISGVSKVLVADAPIYEKHLAEPMAALLSGLMSGYDALLAPATTTGKNILPRVAALLDVSQVSDILSVESPDTFTRPIYAGNAIETVQSSDAKKIITVRTTAFKAAEDGGAASVESVDAADDPGLSSFVGEELSQSDRPELTAAKSYHFWRPGHAIW